jgi:S-adenosylmethionine synthetase
MSILRTAESVSPKHPDKLCDRIAVDVAGGHGQVFVTGEVSTIAGPVDVQPIVQRIAGDVALLVRIEQQSGEIAKGVDTGGAGDQGIMVGYATNQTPEYLPLEVVLSRNLNQALYAHWPYDGKTQVTLRGGLIDSIVASFQHASTPELEQAVKQWCRSQTYLPPYFTDIATQNPTLYINPAGDWNIGGFDADAGLTGRKLVVDNYGPHIPIGGGAFSGKDPSKVDRSAAYMARRIAIDYVKTFNAQEVFVHLAYAIGYDQPLEATARIDGVIKNVDEYDLSPRGIITALNLQRPVYERTAEYGHFGHGGYAWDIE